MDGPRRALTLPALVVLTDARQTRARPLVGVVAAAVTGGARAVILREKHLPPSERADLAAALVAVLDPVGGILVVASSLPPRSEGRSGPGLAAHGLHLGAKDPLPAGAPPLVGRSCHDRASLVAAAAEGCAYATLSPIFPTASKPGYGPALGTAALRDAPLPVWALGGIGAANAAACVKAGAAGVAVMGEVMRAADPAATVAGILAALAGAGS